MDSIINVLKVITPIFATVLLGILAKKQNLVTPEQSQGLQQYVMKFGLPCVLFNSCLGADLGAEAVTSMGLLLPLLFGSAIWSFHARKKQFPYHNFPMLFSAQESGMLGIPLFMTVFGAEQAYRMGVLDMSQALIAIPVISILAAHTGENPSPAQIVKQVFRSPLLIMSLLGLALNLSGVYDLLSTVGIGQIITETTGFLAQPVSAVMLFSVGYTFSLSQGNRGMIFRIAAIHFSLWLLICGIIQAALFLIPDVDPVTRWAVLMYCTLPASFIAPGLGRSDEEHTIASGVCSLLTLVSLLVFCGITIAVA